MSVRVTHDHWPIFRVVRNGWADPLDSSFSRQRSTRNRWNTPEFAALYCCCSVRVARAVTLDLFAFSAVSVEDLAEDFLPQLAEIRWHGTAVDVASPQSIAAAGLQANYPNDSDYHQTQALAANWHAAGEEGIVCRSASVWRLGFDTWAGDHRHWSELVIYPANASLQPALIRRRETLDWLLLPEPQEPR